MVTAMRTLVRTSVAIKLCSDNFEFVSEALTCVELLSGSAYYLFSNILQIQICDQLSVLLLGGIVNKSQLLRLPSILLYD